MVKLRRTGLFSLKTGHGLVSINVGGDAWPCGIDCRRELRYQRLEIDKAVRFRAKHDNGDRVSDQILLKGQVSIYRDEYVKLSARERQQLSILDRRPAHLTSGLDVVANDITSQTPIDAFVEQNLHEAASTIRVLASSRNAMTCSRVTDGKPARNSSMDSPASR